MKSVISLYFMATAVSISDWMKGKLKNLGRAGDSYEDVIRRMYEVTRKNLLMAYFYDEPDSLSIDEAVAEARKKWPESS